MQNKFDSIIYYLSCLKETLNKHEYWFYKLLIVGDDFNAISEFINSVNERKLFKNVDVVLKDTNADFNTLDSGNCHLYSLSSILDYLGENVIVCGNGMEIAYASYKFRIELLNGSFRLYLGDETKFDCQRFYLKSREITNFDEKNYALNRRIGK